MTTKDYRRIAAVFEADMAVHADFPAQRLAIRNVALSMADMLKRDNPRFDRALFLKACGLTHADAPNSIPED